MRRSASTPARSTDTTPPFLDAALTFYRDAFGARRRPELASAMADWGELDDAEQRFTLAHLQYLNVLAQHRTQRLLTQVRDLLAELADGAALDEVDGELAAGAEPDRAEQPDDAVESSASTPGGTPESVVARTATTPVAGDAVVPSDSAATRPTVEGNS